MWTKFLVLAFSEWELWTIWPRVCPKAHRALAKRDVGLCLGPWGQQHQGHLGPTLPSGQVQALGKAARPWVTRKPPSLSPLTSLSSSAPPPLSCCPIYTRQVSVPMPTAPQHALMPLTSQASAGNTLASSWLSHSCSSSETPPRCLPHAHWTPELSPAQRCSQRIATKAQPAQTTMLLFPSCPHQPRTLRAGPLPVHVWVPACQDIDWHLVYFGKYQGNGAECKRWFQFGKQTPQEV